MSNTEIQEGNKLIAEFMGDKWIAQTKGTSYLVGNPKLFHSSWDWLMPVVEKINQIKGFDVIIWKYDCHINDEREIIIECSGNPVIKAVWKAIVKFIQWYNQNKKP